MASLEMQKDERFSSIQDVFIRDETFVPSREEDRSSQETEDVAGNEDRRTVQEQRLDQCCTGDQCMDFTQNTTLHGLRFIWLPGSSTLRRVMWFFLVAGCMSLSSYQILDRILFYYSLPVNVNVKVNFNDSLIFPTVTICNQNTFRARRAEELGYYNLLSEMYSDVKSFNLSRLDSLNATNLTLSDIFAGTAHKKEDMIIGCTWKGEACGPDNFTSRMSDHGMCYTFNHPQNGSVDVMRILDPGENKGLTLILNAEFYEYMPGPHEAVGIKVLVHDHTQFPKVNDLGIALPIGKNSFVPLKFKEVRNLPEPHGDCASPSLDYFRQYSKQNCEIECITKILIENCGCRLHFMPYDKGSPGVCTLTQYLHCYMTTQERHRQEIKNRCQCPEPCHFRTFDPSVSYATISSFVISKYIQGTNKTDLEMTYQQAREISGRQHSQRTSFREAVVNLENIIEACENDMESLQHSINMSFIADKEIYHKMKSTLRAAFFFNYYQLKFFEVITYAVWEPLNEETFSILAQDKAKYLLSIEARLKQLVDARYVDPSVRQTLYLLTGTMLDARLDIARTMRHNCSQIVSNLTEFFTRQINSTLDPYKDLLHAKYMRSRIFQSEAYTRHMSSKIMKDMDDFISLITSYRDMLEKAFAEYKLNITNMLQIRDQYTQTLKKVLRDGNEIFQIVFQNPPDNLKENRDVLLEKKIKLSKSRYIRLSLFKGMVSSMHLISKFLNTFREKIIACKDYLSGRASKLKVARLFFNERSDQERVTLNLIFDKFQTSRKDLEGTLSGILLDYYWVQFFTKRLYIDTRQSTLTSFNLTDLLWFPTREEVKSAYRFKFMLDEDHPVITRKESLLEAIDVLTNLMEEYVETSQVDVNFLRTNILQVDFFYREMSYESITQQVGYDLFALLCDIGGSMGLFIGASVVTVFEVLDLAINVALGNLRRKKQRHLIK